MHRKCVLPDQKHDKSQAPQTAVLFILFPCLTQNLTYHNSAMFLHLEGPERGEFVSTGWQKPCGSTAPTAVGFGSGLGRDLCGMLAVDSRAEKIQASHINTL